MTTYYLDAKRLLCPMPVIKTQEKIKELKTGDILEVICTDPGVLQDIPAWCRVHNHVFLNSELINKEIIVRIQVNNGRQI